jgi:hypothetical protein
MRVNVFAFHPEQVGEFGRIDKLAREQKFPKFGPNHSAEFGQLVGVEPNPTENLGSRDFRTPVRARLRAAPRLRDRFRARPPVCYLMAYLCPFLEHAPTSWQHSLPFG